jgi:hypothetical protein
MNSSKPAFSMKLPSFSMSRRSPSPQNRQAAADNAPRSGRASPRSGSLNQSPVNRSQLVELEAEPPWKGESFRANLPPPGRGLPPLPSPRGIPRDSPRGVGLSSLSGCAYNSQAPTGSLQPSPRQGVATASSQPSPRQSIEVGSSQPSPQQDQGVLQMLYGTSTNAMNASEPWSIHSQHADSDALNSSPSDNEKMIRVPLLRSSDPPTGGKGDGTGV